MGRSRFTDENNLVGTTTNNWSHNALVTKIRLLKFRWKKNVWLTSRGQIAAASWI